MHMIDHRTLKIEQQMRIDEANAARVLAPIRRATRARRINRLRAVMRRLTPSLPKRQRHPAPSPIPHGTG